MVLAIMLFWQRKCLSYFPAERSFICSKKLKWRNDELIQGFQSQKNRQKNIEHQGENARVKK